MAFDGFLVAGLAHELDEKLREGRVQKIAQPEKDELLLTIKINRKNLRLVISVGSAMPYVCMIDENKPSPATAPNFCMLLRKHLSGAKIISIRQIELERVLELELENLNELGDLTRRFIVVELMGKHSNIIFLNEQRMVVDSIKHISSLVSSVREVLPGKPYFIPNTMDKMEPFGMTQQVFIQNVLAKPVTVSKSIYTSLTGFSPIMAQELAFEAGVDGDASTSSLTETQKGSLFASFQKIMSMLENHQFCPSIYFERHAPFELSALPLTIYSDKENREYDSFSTVITTFYSERDTINRIRQKSVDLRKLVNTLLERNRKKLDLQKKQMQDTVKREKYKVYGELINTYGYQLENDAKSLTCLNYYTNEEITIPVDPTKTASENANKYFNRYNKLKRTNEALSVQMKEVENEILHLENISNSLEIAREETDLVLIKEELTESGYMRRKSIKGKKQSKIPKSKPLHFVSSDGFDMYVGKNNYQNDELTFKFANGGDWWFHAKGMAGSHVIVKCPGGIEPPIKTFEEAGSLAAYFSKGRSDEKVEIDYTQKKNVKKPNGGKPGFVVYYTNFSLVANSNIEHISSPDKEDSVFLERSYL